MVLVLCVNTLSKKPMKIKLTNVLVCVMAFGALAQK